MFNIGLRVAGTTRHRSGSAFSHYNTITIDHTKCGSSDSTNFPMVFTGTYSQLAVIASGGYATNSSGYDIVFSTDVDGTMVLPFELVNYTPSTGYCEFWVHIPTLSHTTNTVIYLQVGNASITTNQSNAAGVWGTAYKGVYHFGAPASLSLSDSSQSTNNLTGVSANQATGIIGGGVFFNGAGEYSHNSSPSGIPSGSANPLALEGWFKLSNNQTQELFGFGNNASTDCRFAVFYDGAGNLLGEFGAVGNSFAWPYDTNWHHVVLVMPTGGTNVNQTLIYLDGSLKSPTLASATLNLPSSSTEIAVGAIPGYYGSLTVAGTIDEVHMGTYAPSADFILAEYNSQSSPSTFYTVT